MNDIGNHRMRAIIDMMEDDQIIDEIKKMNVGVFEQGLWSSQGITKQQWYDLLVLEAITRGLEQP